MFNKNVPAKTHVQTHVQGRTSKLLRKSSAQNVRGDTPTYLQLREQSIEAVGNDVIQDTGLLADHAYKVRAMSAVFANNDITYEANRLRAQICAKTKRRHN